MLGFAPISARPISGGPSSLVQVIASVSASVTIALAVSGKPGALTPLSAAISLSLPVSGRLYVHQQLASNVTITFGTDANLRVAGKPIMINALPLSFEVRATMAAMTVKAVNQNFTVRGDR